MPPIPGQEKGKENIVVSIANMIILTTIAFPDYKEEIRLSSQEVAFPEAEAEAFPEGDLVEVVFLVAVVFREVAVLQVDGNVRSTIFILQFLLAIIHILCRNNDDHGGIKVDALFFFL